VIDAIVISATDNVATALEPIESGAAVRAGAETLTALEAIPRGHKIALRAIAAGERVLKYGSPIGTATSPIAAGAHVHTHNVASTRGRGDLARTAQPDASDSISNSIPHSVPHSPFRIPH
jgi:altronate hydrolase